MDNSTPSYGKNDKNPAPRPSKVTRPIPHAAHPGANIPKNTASPPKKLVFLLNLILLLDLYTIKLKNIPKKILIINMKINELKLIIFTKSKTSEYKKLI